MGITESFQAQPSSHQIRLPQDSEYNDNFCDQYYLIFAIHEHQEVGYRSTRTNGKIRKMNHIKIGGVSVGDGHPPFIIAEMSGNHNQSLEKALEIVEAAASVGASAIKLQTYTADTLTIKSKKPDFLVDSEKSLWKDTYLHDLYAKAYTPWEWHKEIFSRARELGILCFSSAFDETAIDFLEDLNTPIYKIASFENGHLPLIRKAAETGKPMIISTGMSTLDEIEEAVTTARDAGCAELILLKCTSEYPASLTSSNLASIGELRTKFGCLAGISDHTLGIGAAIAGVALGACVVEKHFTISRSDGGVDAEFSNDLDEFRNLVSECTSAWQAIGQSSFGVSDGEKDSVKFRRSIYAVQLIVPGDKLTRDNIRIIRPGYGLHPRNYESLLGSVSPYRLDPGDRVDDRFSELME